MLGRLFNGVWNAEATRWNELRQLAGLGVQGILFHTFGNRFSGGGGMHRGVVPIKPLCWGILICCTNGRGNEFLRLFAGYCFLCLDLVSDFGSEPRD